MINLADFIKPKTQLAEILNRIEITAESFVLVYVPFTARHHELIQPHIHLAINKNIIALSDNL